MQEDLMCRSVVVSVPAPGLAGLVLDVRITATGGGTSRSTCSPPLFHVVCTEAEDLKTQCVQENGSRAVDSIFGHRWHFVLFSLNLEADLQIQLINEHTKTLFF